MLRLALSPRWIVWHVLTLGAMVTCGLLAAWQWERAGSAMGSVLNIGYGVQWPIFAVFFGVMWWRFLRMEVLELRAIDASNAAAPGGTADAVVAAHLQNASGGRSPAGRPARPADAAADVPPASVRSLAADSPLASVRSASPAADARFAPVRGAGPAEPSPFRRAPRHATAVTEAEDPELAEYNRMLGALAERDAATG